MRKVGWGLMTLLAVLVSGYALSNAVIPGVRSPFVGDLFSAKALRTLGHLSGGGIALLVGAFQFNTAVRNGRPSVHRRLGLVYLTACLVGGISAGLLAPSSSGGVAAHYGFGMLAVLWITTSFVAFASARSGDYVAHRRWMIRSYALCLAAVTLRLYLPLAGLSGIPFEAAYPAIAWLCWVPNLVVAEWIVLPSSIASVESAA